MKTAIKHLVNRILAAAPSAGFMCELWDGEKIGVKDDPRVILKLNSRRSGLEMIRKGFLGFGEGYMSGEIEVEGDLQELMRLGFAINFDDEAIARQKIGLLWQYLKSRNTQNRVQKNISAHYDMGNEFYALYLDNTMTYSCAYFKKEDEALERAQLNKYEHVGRKLMLRSGESLVDVGCGWGGMLIYAAREFNIQGLGITLSRNQYEYANRKIRELRLDGQIQVVMKDYRQLSGKFDKLVSIGMFEHVGKKFIPTFVRKTAGLLKEGGLGLLHTIGKDVESVTDPWTIRYIFPGGYLPNLAEICHHIGREGLYILDVENLRTHYARTLDRWAENFEKNANKACQMFGETLVRMWRLYLNGSSAGFKYGDSRLYQILFSNGLNNDLPLTREHLYKEERSSYPA